MDSPFISASDSSKLINKLGHFYQNQPVLPILKCKYFESPINQSQIQYDCTAPIARNTPENNEVKLIEYRHSQVASFTVDGKDLICLPQAFELFLKNLVGGLHTVYTKLKRLDIVPIVCNVEQVRHLCLFFSVVKFIGFILNFWNLILKRCECWGGLVPSNQVSIDANWSHLMNLMSCMKTALTQGKNHMLMCTPLLFNVSEIETSIKKQSNNIRKQFTQ